MIEPDVRELLYYDLSNMLAIEPDFVPHYFSTLIDKFRVLISGGESLQLPICSCGGTDIMDFKGEKYCLGNYVPEFKETKFGPVCISVTPMNPREIHVIKNEFIMGYINKVIMDVLRLLQEPSGYLMNLYILEGYLFRQDNDDFFETVEGDIRKSSVLRELYKIKKSISGYMGLLRQDIRFTASLKTPPVRMG